MRTDEKFVAHKNMPISTMHLNAEIRLTMLCVSGFELYSRWVPLNSLNKFFQSFHGNQFGVFEFRYWILGCKGPTW